MAIFMTGGGGGGVILPLCLKTEHYILAQEISASYIRFTGCGLAGRYRQDDELKTLVRRAAVLPLVPLDQVDDVWFSALDDNEDISGETTRLKDYVTEIWIEGQHIAFWNHYDNDGPRTTNHVEGWHSKVNKLCQHAHPNIFVAVQLLKKIQATNEAKIIQLSAGGKQRPKKRKYCHIDYRLSHLKDRYRNGQIDVLTYADAASHLQH
ncbi:LOW QUALITY PROTEIN: uncharacterized protein LOC117336618 [Pecten maximus]|uniref:LOW QUALITY PROTEIN: uncharacterized protein LOC117336618 n=1 Tax=Pecten maximus TaxID=6579 RepID=UPI001458B212|nr:LOW QUALITY PROTEIN: uncharacterized protein LOC117336618 [Pecten maximus]